MQHVEFKDWSAERRAHFEVKAAEALSDADAHLEEAMRYALLDGGKRVRALLVYAAGIVTGAKSALLDEAALAVECIHAYSLVHDDMPCMDNDVLRRGKPTTHVKFGEATALLAADALQTEAFVRLTSGTDEAVARVELVRILSDAAGRKGMCGGQQVDIDSVGVHLDIPSLRRMHAMKTGALIRAAVLMGGAAGEGNLYSRATDALRRYAEAIGLGFQVVDDILDVTADSATLGKTAGKDEMAEKPTYVTLLGLDEARRLARSCHSDALAALDEIDATDGVAAGSTVRLREIADYVVGRSY